MRNSGNFLFTVQVAAGSQKPIPHPGTYVRVKEASAIFDIEFDDWGKQTIEAGTTLRTGEDRFKGVTLYNRSTTAALTVTIWIG